MNAKQRRAKRRQAAQDQPRIEIARSFSYKQMLENIGGPRYESVDFFMSAKTTCNSELAEQTAGQLYAFCKKIIIRDRQAFAENFQAEFGLKTTEAPRPHRAAESNARAYEQHQQRNSPTPTQQAVAAAKISTDKLPEHLRPTRKLPPIETDARFGDGSLKP